MCLCDVLSSQQQQTLLRVNKEHRGEVKNITRFRKALLNRLFTQMLEEASADDLELIIILIESYRRKKQIAEAR